MSIPAIIGLGCVAIAVVSFIVIIVLGYRHGDEIKKSFMKEVEKDDDL